MPVERRQSAEFPLAMATDHQPGDVVEFTPGVTGGHVVAVVTAVHEIPLHGTSLTIRITDGTTIWLTGSTETIPAVMVD